MYMYVNIILLGNFIYNPHTVKLGAWIRNNVPFAYWLNETTPHMTNIYFGDYLFLLGCMLAFFGSFMYTYKMTNLRYAIGKTVFTYSVFAAAIIFFTVEITNSLTFMLFHVTAKTSGFPWWSASPIYRFKGITYAYAFAFFAVCSVISYILLNAEGKKIEEI